MTELMERDRVHAEYEQYDKQGRIWGEVPIERIRTLAFPRVSEEVRRAFLELTDLTTSVADSLDAHGICGAIAQSHLPNLIPGKRIAGTAVTLRNVPERKTPTQGGLDKDPIKMSSRECHYIAEPGDVLCVDFGGNVEASNMGGQSCLVAKMQGLSGAVVDGAVRDLNTIRELDFPIWCRGGTPKTGKYRMEAIEVNGPVTIHDILVEPGDFIVADDSGICAIPPQLVETILAECQKTEASEARSREMIRNKSPLSELKPLFRARYNET
ncbi:RraA family protein [Pseudoruegeria sp. HB172150]|uniref:RraA family protein n=1 Tax=Pseudoruegeria sp. HB172150 TaxID=2721164 RepID=UPI001554D049|nr:RraA family protein [Pseudoruegeria sp. HB172150]